MFIGSVSRDASNERINSLYSCRKYIKKKTGSVLHLDLIFADALAICSLISLTKCRVFSPPPPPPPPDMTCILSCRIPGPRAETATKSNRLSIYMYNHRVDMRPKPQSFGIRKGILHTWLRSHLVGLGAWVGFFHSHDTGSIKF